LTHVVLAGVVGVESQGNVRSKQSHSREGEKMNPMVDQWVRRKLSSNSIWPFNGAEPVFELPYWGGVEPQVDPLDRFDVLRIIALLSARCARGPKNVPVNGPFME
jgi:hypothetical protein